MKSRKRFIKHYCSKDISKAGVLRLELTVNGIPVGELQLLPHSKYMSIYNGTGDSLALAKKTDLRKGPKSEFGRKFLEHYGIGYADDTKLYNRENTYYHKHGRKCSWELEDSKRKGIEAQKRPRFYFNLMFKKHYGFSYVDNPKLYNREYYFYRHHGRCRWELEDSKKSKSLKRPRFYFNQEFKKHYGFSYVDNPKLYNREYYFYRHHGRCRWELGFDKPPRNFDFGKKFKEYYGMTYTDNPKFYNREYNFFHKHGRCRWELEDKSSENFDFEKKFKEHYGIGYADNPMLYSLESIYFHKHGKYSWE